MRSMKLHKIGSWILLIYFAGFILPPMSSLASVQQKAAMSAGTSSYRIVQDHRNTAPLLFDIILWQQFKKTKHSKEFIFSTPDFSNCSPANKSFEYKDAASHFTLKPFQSANRSHHVSLLHQARSSHYCFSRSGISPPSHSS